MSKTASSPIYCPQRRSEQLDALKGRYEKLLGGLEELEEQVDSALIALLPPTSDDQAGHSC